jgi:hypothetical protein
MSDIVHSVQTSFENRFLLLKMDLDIENYTITKFDNLKSKNELLGLCCNSGSLIARDGFPQEIWLKIFSYLRVLDLRKCVQVCKWMHCICLDRSLKYLAVREIYQTTSNRFIKTLFYFKENELVYYLMTTAPDFWSIDSCWHEQCNKEKWAQPVEDSRDWHKSVTNGHRNEMTAIL